LIGKGQGIHWEEIDEDISVEGFLAGKPSGESQNSFERWLSGRLSKYPLAEPGALGHEPLKAAKQGR
jgi:hypothetical protein